MSLESISRLASLTGVAKETVRKRCEGLKTKKGPRRAILLESKEALPRILQVKQGGEVEAIFDNQLERLNKYRADHEALKVAELEGKLVRVDAAVATWQYLLTALRAKLLSMPSRLAVQIATMTEAVECQDLIESVVHEALGELSETGLPDDIAERLAEGPGGVEASAEADSQ